MSIRQIGVIAKREYIATVKRREFLLVTFGLPLFYVFLFFIIGVTSIATARTVEERKAPAVIGFLDQSGVLNRDALTGKQDEFTGKIFADVKAGQKAVRDKRIRALVVVPTDFAKSGRVTVYQDGGSVFGRGGRESVHYSGALHTALLLRSGITAETARRALADVNATTYDLNRKTDRFEIPDTIREIGKFAVPYGFSLLLMLAIFISSSYLLGGVIEEKENRVIEVLLSSVTHEELLAGKMIGLGGAGLTQIALWGTMGILPLLIFPKFVPYTASLPFTPLLFVTALLMFLFGFALYAAMMAGVGSLGSSWRESQQLSSVAVTFAVIPIMLITSIIEVPDGALARFLSLFPLTAPIGMMLRVGAEGASWGEVLLSVALIAVTTWLAIVVSARLFRLSLLSYGQKPTFQEVWRYLTYKPS